MDPNRFQRIAKALADPRRFEIFEEMAASSDELACGRIVERFPVTQATISHHLKELNDAGLIEIRPEGSSAIAGPAWTFWKSTSKSFGGAAARLANPRQLLDETPGKSGLTPS